ncbi:uncharacterized protein LOC6572380 [Drosophila mojavensis]|uniref:Uncharacterized protein, isoform A n=1 Tax=Drosophila mojavensis TaxID=7230 RepID=B4K4X9_DROMO|nr:uncharacterized protein LOC6572380 [Drosophila mojavensis]EDW13950.2 uncharacterized protein Dmoj_GI23607, isoform A [Drosophila mojavensis]KRG00738.1 uncharacterized protein Dmoj_GI23607, isoform B [Drosophila mojavensis]
MKMSFANQKAMSTKAAFTSADADADAAAAAAAAAGADASASAAKVASAVELPKASRATVSPLSGPPWAFLLLGAILLCCGGFGLVDGLKCHMCGQYNEGVGSITPCTNYSKEIAHLYLKECTKKSEKFCVKYVSELSTVRDCATECVEKEIWETQTYCCKEDGCNSSGLMKASIFLVSLPIIMWLF